MHSNRLELLAREVAAAAELAARQRAREVTETVAETNAVLEETGVHLEGRLGATSRPTSPAPPSSPSGSDVQGAELPGLLSKQEIAALLGVHVNTVDRVRRDDPFFPTPKRIPGGRKLLWSRTNLERWIDTLDARG